MIEDSTQNDEVFMTSSTKLATALLALGNTLRRPPCTRQVRKDGRTIVTFLFNPSTADAIDGCGKIAVRWSELESQDPGDGTPDALRARLLWLTELTRKTDDAVAVAYANASWRDVCLSIVKATPRMVEVRAGSSVAFFREDASPSEIKQMQRYL
jgi:hypothetical protein